MREIDSFVRDLDKRVVQVTASIAASLQEVEILRPEGLSVRDVRPMTRINVSVILEHAGRRESGSAGGGGRVGLDGLLDPADWQAKAREAVRIASVNLEAVPAPAGVMDVVLGPGWANLAQESNNRCKMLASPAQFATEERGAGSRLPGIVLDRCKGKQEQELANTAWACATVKQSDEKLFGAWAKGVERRIGEFNA